MQILCDTCSNTKKLLPSKGRTHDHMHYNRSCPTHLAITDTSNDDTIVILVITLTIMHIMVKLQYIDTLMCKLVEIEVN